MNYNKWDPTFFLLGSGMIKAGFAGEQAPRALFASVVGRVKGDVPIMAGIGDPKGFYVGDVAQQKRGILALRYPIENGIVGNWDDMEAVWHHTFFNELRVDPEDHGVLLTDAPLNPKANREKMAEVMFEKFGVKWLNVSLQAVLSLYSTGRTTGIIADSGAGVTHLVPIFDGYGIDRAVSRVNLAGRELTMFMRTLLMSAGHRMQTSAETEIVRDIKEKHCFVAENYDEALKDQSHGAVYKVYLMPDGQEIKIGQERFKCTEALFHPSMIGKQCQGVHHQIYTSIMKTDIDVRRQLYENIVLSGGSSMFSGLRSRLTNELEHIVPSSINIKIDSPKHRKFSVWIGGSILASLSGFTDHAKLSASEYAEYGGSFIHRKCI
ncbi:unnamed protein product [Oikopleura dioica]|uniref:Uncharacterized protein n=1 Tax=Oikopleura dioica TaxID=34765 RepID=E4XMR2_OIKDI|nr:unnamed protein product [Oikopleura dioica]CBY37254.1 unnamed protein product [Oikopleura dioica]